MSHCPSGWGASRSTMGGARLPLQVVDTGHARASRGGKQKASRGFEPRSLDSESRVLTVTPRGQMLRGTRKHHTLSLRDTHATVWLHRSQQRRTHTRGKVRDVCSPDRMSEAPTVGLEPTTTRLRALRFAD